MVKSCRNFRNSIRFHDGRQSSGALDKCLNLIEEPDLNAKVKAFKSVGLGIPVKLAPIRSPAQFSVVNFVHYICIRSVEFLLNLVKYS